jgi:hypothetical protein
MTRSHPSTRSSRGYFIAANQPQELPAIRHLADPISLQTKTSE